VKRDAFAVTIIHKDNLWVLL